MLELKNVSKFYYQKGMITAGFSRINLKLDMGEFVVITGESGSGKSTLLNVLSGLDTYEEGEMLINGEETSHYVEKDFERYRKKYIGNIFQNFNLVNSYTVYQNVELTLLLSGKSTAEVCDEVNSVIDKVGLSEYRDTKVAKLSGGQKQRVAIARALAKETPIIVADEPTGNLDSESATDIINILSEVAKDKLVIVVTHNLEQVKAHATRLIKMHDGKILEDEVVNEVTEPEDINASEPENITWKNKIKLGIRNSFNIIPKFVLIFAVFFFISMALLGVYSSFSETNSEQSETASNSYFKDTSPERIVLNKKDGSPLSEEELNTLAKTKNVNKIVKNDILLDMSVQIDSDMYYISGAIRDINNYKGKLDHGKMPATKDEFIVVAPEDDNLFSQDMEKAMADKYYMSDPESGTAYEGFDSMHVSGVKFSDELKTTMMDDDYIIYASPEVLQEVTLNYFKSHSQMKYTMEGKTYTEGELMFEVRTNSSVPSGQAYAADDLGQYYKSGTCKNKSFTIKAKTLYYSGSSKLKISKTYNSKDSYKKMFGSTKGYEEGYSYVYVNPNDIRAMYKDTTYQCSVYVKDANDIDDTISVLNGMGYSAISISDTLYDPMAEINKVLNIFKAGVLVALIIALFFISYFVIKIILRSRKSYFATIRTLGGMNRDIKEILIVELFVIASLAFIFALFFVGLVGLGVIDVAVLNNMCEHLGLKEYIILYVVIAGMSYLISARYARSIFKSSVIGTFNEEV